MGANGPGPTHNDLKPDHLLLTEDWVGLIDFDLLVAGDPVADVANLVTHLTKARSGVARGGAPEREAARVFVDEYFAHAPADWRPRLPLQQALAGLSKAAALARQRPAGWSEKATALVAEARTLVNP